MIELYEDIITVAKSYVGIAAEDYIKRRCSVSFQLNNPVEIRTEDIDRLVESIGLTAENYMSTEKVQQFKADILKLKGKYS